MAPGGRPSSGRFPGATAPPDEADYVVVGAPLDASTTFEPGTRFGPRRLRHYATAFDDYDRRTDQHFTNLAVADHGDVGPTDDVAEYLQFLEDRLVEYATAGTVPLLVGGEHAVTIAALRALEPSTYVCLDAHLDLYESYANNPLSHATVTHHALDVADRVVVLGGRTGSEHEWARVDSVDERRLTVVAPADVPAWVDDVGEGSDGSDDSEGGDAPSLAEVGDVYLSVDVDAADPAYAPGTGTREPFGLDPATMRDVVRTVAPHAVGADVVEVNDRDDGQAAVLGAKLLREAVFAHAAAADS